MNFDLMIGLILLVIFAVLLLVGLPSKSGVSPSFLQFKAALVLYPPFLMVFLVGGAAEILKWFLSTP